MPRVPKLKKESEAESVPVKKKRAENWSTEEIVTLVNALEPVYSKLCGKLSAELGPHQKKSAWATIVASVNSVSDTTRDTEAIKSKLKDLKTRTKEAVRSKLTSKKTGGGESEEITMTEVEQRIVDMSEWEKKITRLIGITALTGIKGGVDTFESKVPGCTDLVVRNDGSPPEGASSNSEHDNKGKPDLDVGAKNNPTSESVKETTRKATKQEVLTTGEKLVKSEASKIDVLSRIALALEEHNMILKIDRGLDPTVPLFEVYKPTEIGSD